MPPLQRLSAMRSRAFRRSEGPKTPEPTSQGDVEQPPSPPRQRFRLRKRAASHLNTAPTSQFLASVAAADVAIPSIEEPVAADEDMVDLAGNITPQHDACQADAPQDGSLYQRTFSPPRTPVPEGLGIKIPRPSRFPDWSIDSSLSDSDCESSRPSTARSTQTTASLFSQLSSYTADDLSVAASPVKEHVPQFDSFLSPKDAERTIRAPGPSNSRKRKAHWTQPMSKHLWSTYTMYLQDPKVTPVRIGPSGVPPYGVVVRVAREARRSWKGSNTSTQPKNHSGSTTPTAEAPAPFLKWPHTNAATRAHLIELCKANAGAKARNDRYFASSPTPYGKTVTRSRARRMTPARSPSVFSGSDMAMSLAVSTSDSMQLGGPLAQLTSSAPQQQNLPAFTSIAPFTSLAPHEFEPEPRQLRLGSPFVAKSYGPSSSSSLAEALSPELPRQSNTVGPRRGLKSPARLSRSRSNTQKRRADLELRRSKRPSLPSDMWSEPATSPIAPYSDNNNNNMGPASPPIAHQQPEAASATGGRERLGSPFGGLPSSFSFPARSGGLDAIDTGMFRRPFASVHQPFGDVRPRTPLPDRLAYLDERLKQFRQRDEERRRSESPL